MSDAEAREILMTMSPRARRALARYWFLKGFSASGIGFNGENFDREKYPAVESLIVAYFEGVYEGVAPQPPRAGGAPKPRASSPRKLR